jgi:hypothetical protein
MRTRILAAVGVVSLIATIGLVGSPAQAARTTTLTFNVDLVSTGTTLQTLPGDITYGWNDLQGPTRWGKSSAQMRFLGSVDYVDGTGPFGGFVTVTRADGVSIAFSVTGWATTPSDEEGTANARFRGTLTVIGGTGPFAGAKGTGTMKGYRKAALGSPVELSFTAVVEKKK